MDTSHLAVLAQKIQRSKKYQHLSTETILRILRWAEKRYKAGEMEKQAKKKLHQVFGAYFGAGEKAGLEKRIRGYDAGSDSRAFFLEIMRLHASSRERVDIVTSFYQEIFSIAKRPSKVIDLACGLNPFSYPWLADALPDMLYEGYDIDLDTTSSLDGFFKKEGLPVSVGYNDLFISVPPHEADDTVMLLKTLPCLEQQEKGISGRLLAQMRCDQLIISFPAKSLGGKEKGMVESYRAFLDGLLVGSGYRLRGEVLFESETAYVLGREKDLLEEIDEQGTRDF